MRIVIAIICLFCFTKSTPSVAQSKAKPREATTESIFYQKMANPRPATLAEGVVMFGKTFLGKPYPKSRIDTTRRTDGTVKLQPISKEVLVVNLKYFDCVTFVENMIALTQARQEKTPSYGAYKKHLTNVRYRNGVVDYAARLHYFSDWIFENEKRGLIKNITKELGGEPFLKDVFYMSLKKDTMYGNMADKKTFAAVKAKEAEITKRDKFFIPKERVAEMESRIKEGDIIGITNRTEGMDMAHTGIAIWQNGRVYMLHASSQFKQVVITDVPLVDYLLRNKLQTGIMVARFTK